MTILPPDDVLESLLCSYCHKFLSVGPVRVYPDNKTKCGRCIENKQDGGVVSLFGIIGEHCVFKCINRFDGCRKLLKYSEVSSHETHCKSKEYSCPMCPNGTDFPTYLMIKHFEAVHPDALLPRPTFNMDSNDWSGNKGVFLHRKDNHLFFISYELDGAEGHLVLKIFLVGGTKEAENITHTFFIRNSSRSCFKTSVGFCIPYGIGDCEGIHVNVKTLIGSQMINVEFELDVNSHENFIELPSSTEIRSTSTSTDLTVPVFPLVQKTDKWTNTINSEMLKAFECFSIWAEEHRVLLLGLCAVIFFLMYALQQSYVNCLENLERERQKKTCALF